MHQRRIAWQTYMVHVVAFLLSNPAVEARRLAFSPRGAVGIVSAGATRPRPIASSPSVQLRGGADTSSKEDEKTTKGATANEMNAGAVLGSNSILDESSSSHTETATLIPAAAQEAVDKDKEKEPPADEKEQDTDLVKDRVDVPSLDTFINYDEAADALSSMAPILETTTTHVLDRVSAHVDMANKKKGDTTTENPQVDGHDNKVADDESASTDGEETIESQDEMIIEETVDTPSMEIPEHLSIDEAQERSSLMRLEGKQLHDDANYEAAARAFCKAALLLEPFVDESTECAEDWSTCRLHEALCCLKADASETAVEACTRVLDRPSTSGAVRARALYRRAKAYSGLEEHDLALQDARGAAFLGDRRGVTLYGQLMRESSAESSSSFMSHDIGNSGSSSMSDLASSSALFESLLSKGSSGMSNTDQMEDNFPPFNPMSLLSGMGGGSAKPGSTGMDTGGLAKSVISSLSKRLEDEATQDTICKYLQKASGSQIQQYAGMAGMELPESQATRIANFLRGVTPKTIRRTVKNCKRLLYGIQLIRKTSKVISKYRNVLIWICLLAWAKSAFLRPIPVNKRIARLAAKQTAKGA